MKANETNKEKSTEQVEENDPKTKDQLISYSDLSLRWKIPVQTLRIWVMKGKLKVVKLGRQVRFALSYICSIEEAGGF